MVRTIDGTARRRVLAEAVWRIVLRDGLAAASVRSVARETDLSAGSVRHFFGTQQELITFAMRELLDTVGERIRAHADLAEVTDPVDHAARILGEMMPFTDASHAEAFAFFQFVMQSRFDAALEPIATESFALIHAACLRVVDALRAAGRVPADVDSEVLARTMWAVVDGLSVQLLFAPALMSRHQARRTLTDFLEGIAVS